MKKIFVLSLLLAMFTGVFAQQAKVVKFAERTHDFGTIKEEDGRVTCVFTFDNLTNSPITLTKVRASCGCTTPSWSREPIAPNGEGKVTVTYNAKGRPGMFQKSITIQMTNGNDTYTEVVYIKGKVTPKPRTPQQGK